MNLEVEYTTNSKSPSDYQESPADQEERIYKLFKQLDVNEDGLVCLEDIKRAFLQVGLAESPDGIKKYVEDSGPLNFQEFIQYVIESEKQLLIFFKHLDENNDGHIDVHEIVKAFHKLGMTVTQEEAYYLLQRMDKDGSLTITFDEWRDYLLFHPNLNVHDVLKRWRHKTFVDIGEDVGVPEDFSENEINTGMWWRHLLAGGVAGAVSRTCTAPLDRVKVFLQVKGSEFCGISTCFQHMLKEGGMKSLWRGNGINILKIAPESALKFMAYEQVKRLIRGPQERELGIYERFAAGSTAGALSQTAIYPMEVLKTRLALRTTGQYSGIWDAACKIYKYEGVKSFYRGYIPNLLGIIPYAGIDLAIYETLKKTYIRRHSVDTEPGVFVLLGCGTVSSSCGQLASYPLALVRTRLQAQAFNNSKSSANMVELFQSILRHEGLAGLYRGITPNFMKVAPAVSISYVVYEHTRRALGVTML